PALIPTLTLPATELVLATPTPTWTATVEGPVMLEVLANTGEVNVRQMPDPASQRLGTIQPGEQFVARGRYFRWLAFEYDQSPSGIGWVFEDQVTIIGDGATIPAVDPYSEPTATPDAARAALVQTLEAVTLTPGADLTVIAQNRVLSLPTAAVSATPDGETGILPTFTPPAEVVPPGNNAGANAVAASLEASVIENALTRVTAGTVPPIVPIGLLLAGGLLGLLVSSLRR
nr:hypothetical protein [Anaerolineae bacterium]